MTSKYCTKCKATKPTASFHVNNKRSDKLCAYCKDCIKKYHAIYYKTPNGISISRKHAKKYRSSEKGKKHAIEYTREYRKTDKYKSYQKKYKSLFMLS